MVTLYNVIDTRTGKLHSEVRVKQRMVRVFVPAEEEALQEQVMAVSTTNEDEGATR